MVLGKCRLPYKGASNHSASGGRRPRRFHVIIVCLVLSGVAEPARSHDKWNEKGDPHDRNRRPDRRRYSFTRAGGQSDQTIVLSNES